MFRIKRASFSPPNFQLSSPPGFSQFLFFSSSPFAGDSYSEQVPGHFYYSPTIYWGIIILCLIYVLLFIFIAHSPWAVFESLYSLIGAQSNFPTSSSRLLSSNPCLRSSLSLVASVQTTRQQSTPNYCQRTKEGSIVVTRSPAAVSELMRINRSKGTINNIQYGTSKYGSGCFWFWFIYQSILCKESDEAYQLPFLISLSFRAGHESGLAS